MIDMNHNRSEVFSNVGHFNLGSAASPTCMDVVGVIRASCTTVSAERFFF